MADYINFLKGQPAKITLSSEDEDIKPTSYSSSFVNSLKGYVQLSSSEDQEMQPLEEKQSWSFKFGSIFAIQQSYIKFGIFLSIGLMLLFFSLMFLPIFWLSPKKFVSFFSFGSFFTIFSFIFFYGTKEFCSMLFSSERQGYTLVYFCSTFIGIYYSYNPTFYLITLLCSIAQLIVTIVFILSFIPGGKSGIAFIISLITAPVRKLLNK